MLHLKSLKPILLSIGMYQLDTQLFVANVQTSQKVTIFINIVSYTVKDIPKARVLINYCSAKNFL